MAWTNEQEVTAYIARLKEIAYSEKGLIKTGVDNYKKILEYAESIVDIRKKEKTLALTNINAQLAKYDYFISRLEEDLETKGTIDNISIFQKNIQTLGDTSVDMVDINNKVLTIVTIDLSRLKQYKRSQKELLSKSSYLKEVLKFYEESKATLSELKAKLT